MAPLRSPFGLIQEDLWPHEWLILVSCIMLNMTNRRQVEKIFPEFVARWPSAHDFLPAGCDEVCELIGPLGLAQRRTTTIKKMTAHYLTKSWSDAQELPGIGEYGGTAWKIFCMGDVPEECPKDGALALYWRWWHERQAD